MKILIQVLILLSMTSCIIESNYRLLFNNKGYFPLYSNTILHNDTDSDYFSIKCNENNCIMTNTNNETNYITFYQIKNSNDYIIQLQTSDNKYNYIFVNFNNDKLFAYNYTYNDVVNKIGSPKNGEITISYVENVFNYVKDKINDKYLLYYIYNADDQNTLKILNDKIKKNNQQKEYNKKYDPPKESNGWKYLSKKDPMNDSVIHYISGSPTKFEGTNNSPIFYMTCANSENFVSIAWNSYLKPENGKNDDIFSESDDLMTILEIRFDKRKSENLIFRLSPDRENTYEGNKMFQNMHFMAINFLSQLNKNIKSPIQYWNGNVLGKAISQSDIMIIRATKSDRSYATAIFETKGYKEVVKNFPSSCQ